MRSQSWDSTHKGVGHPRDLLGGREAVSEITAAKRSDAAFAGELGHVDVEIHPVDAVQFHDDMY